MVSLFLEWNNKLFNSYSVNNNNNDNIIFFGSNLNSSIKKIILDKHYNNPKFIINKHLYSDKFSFDIEENILTIKRIDSDYGWAYEHSVIIIDE